MYVHISYSHRNMGHIEFFGSSVSTTIIIQLSNCQLIHLKVKKKLSWNKKYFNHVGKYYPSITVIKDPEEEPLAQVEER